MTTLTNLAPDQTEAEATILRVRGDLMKAATHWAAVADESTAAKAADSVAPAAEAGASMACTYAYVLSALLGQMADTENEGLWTAEQAAEFVEDLVVNGDSDDLNCDVSCAVEMEPR